MNLDILLKTRTKTDDYSWYYLKDELDSKLIRNIEQVIGNIYNDYDFKKYIEQNGKKILYIFCDKTNIVFSRLFFRDITDNVGRAIYSFEGLSLKKEEFNNLTSKNKIQTLNLIITYILNESCLYDKDFLKENCKNSIDIQDLKEKLTINNKLLNKINNKTLINLFYIKQKLIKKNGLYILTKDSNFSLSSNISILDNLEYNKYLDLNSMNNFKVKISTNYKTKINSNINMQKLNYNNNEHKNIKNSIDHIIYIIDLLNKIKNKNTIDSKYIFFKRNNNLKYIFIQDKDLVYKNIDSDKKMLKDILDLYIKYFGLEKVTKNIKLEKLSRKIKVYHYTYSNQRIMYKLKSDITDNKEENNIKEIKRQNFKDIISKIFKK